MTLALSFGSKIYVLLHTLQFSLSMSTGKCFLSNILWSIYIFN